MNKILANSKYIYYMYNIHVYASQIRELVSESQQLRYVIT